jgi:hypothetical protein
MGKLPTILPSHKLDRAITIEGSTMSQEPSRTLDQAVLAAWQDELKATCNPSIKQPCLQRAPDLLPRFAAHYQQLKTLRRRVRRSLQRQWKRSLAGVALLIALGQAPLLAATINVGGTCSLIKAIVAANKDTTVNGCTAGSGADKIVLPSGSTQTLTFVQNNVYGPTGLPVIRSEITIVGNNSTIRRVRTAPDFRMLAVAGAGDLRLQETRVTHGSASEVSRIEFSDSGGGLLNYGVLTVHNSIISDNDSPHYGGGIQNYSDATITNSIIRGNDAGAGGGVSNESGILTVTNSTISGNVAIEHAGGIDNFQGTITIRKSTISDNDTPHYGGGLVNHQGSEFRITNSTISGNTAGDGGGIHNSGYLGVTNSTISRNSTSRDGGGVSNTGTLTLTRSLISGNTASNEIAVPNLAQEVFNDTNATIIAERTNLFGRRGITNAQAFENFAPTTDITATSDGNTPTRLRAILDTHLANNGGPTRTHALVSGSPAVDAVTDGTCPPPNTDQRGVTRPQDGDNDGAAICDTGAFERR